MGVAVGGPGDGLVFGLSPVEFAAEELVELVSADDGT